LRVGVLWVVHTYAALCCAGKKIHGKNGKGKNGNGKMGYGKLDNRKTRQQKMSGTQS